MSDVHRLFVIRDFTIKGGLDLSLEELAADPPQGYDFGRWVEVFKSKEMTVALLDRLTHRCDVIVMTGKSKRREESLERQKSRHAAKRKQVKTRRK